MSREVTRFYFGDIVVVEKELIGVVVKTWFNDRKREFIYEVYVREFNTIQDYREDEVQRYIVSKEISEEEKDFHFS